MNKSKEACSGCYNEQYHYGLGGAKECFSYESAKIVDKIAVGVDEMPPFDKARARPMMSCYTRQRSCFVEPSSLTEQGFWK